MSDTETSGLPDWGPRPVTLHQAIAQGLTHALSDFGVDLIGCSPATLTGHVIHNLKRIPGWCPPAQVIDDAEGLSALRTGTVIRSRLGDIASVDHGPRGDWTGVRTVVHVLDIGVTSRWTVSQLVEDDSSSSFPWTVVWSPAETARQAVVADGESR